jgi:TfoX/Sxy family transcriptional regulator of competence genes
MAYDEKLAARVRGLLARNPAFSVRRMFGGICYMLNGNMCAGVLNNELIVRAAPEPYAAALKRPYARAFDFTGRPMKGFVVVGANCCNTAARLAGWIALGLRVAQALPPKKAPKKSRPRTPS